MKNFIFLMLLLLAFSFGNLQAQQERVDKTPEERATFRSEQMAKRFSLDATGKQGVYQAVYDFSVKLNELRAKQEKGRRDQFEALEAELDAKMETILGPENYQVYLKTKQERKDQLMSNQTPQK
jgi:hypothetical protein